MPVRVVLLSFFISSMLAGGGAASSEGQPSRPGRRPTVALAGSYGNGAQAAYAGGAGR